MNVVKTKSKDFISVENSILDCSLVGVNFRLDMPKDLHPLFLKDCLNYLSNLKKADGKPSVTFHISRGPPNLVVNDDKILLVNNAQEEQLVRDTVLLMSKILERELNRRDIFSLHASGVSANGKAIAIIGPGGSGKTTSAVYTCMLDRTICFVSGNRIFVRGTDVIDGASGVRLRAGSLGQELGLSSPALEEIGFYDAKVSLTPAEIGIVTTPSYPLKLTKIIVVRKFERELTVEKLNMANEEQMNDAFLNLYNCASEFSENFPSFILGPKIPYPNVFTTKLKEARISFIKGLLRNIEVIKVEGKLKEIASFVKNEIRG